MFECPGEGERLENICDLATTGVSRTTAGQIIQRQFRELLDRADLKVDKHTGKEHELYSLLHTAICMRIVKSHGHVNIFTLAKNAGTSVDQIERFYGKHLPMVLRAMEEFAEFWRSLGANVPNRTVPTAVGFL